MLAEIDGGLMKWETVDGGPEVQGIAAGSTREAVIDLPGKMVREGAIGSGRTAGDRAGSAKLPP